MDDTAEMNVDEIGEGPSLAERSPSVADEHTLPMHDFGELDSEGIVGEDETREDEASDSVPADPTTRRLQARIDDLEDRFRRLTSERDRLQRRVLSQERDNTSLQRRTQEHDDFTSQKVGDVFRMEDMIRRADGAERALAAAHEEIESLNHRILLLESGDAAAALDELDASLADLSASLAAEAERDYVPSGAPLGAPEAVRARFEQQAEDLAKERRRAKDLEAQLERFESRLVRAKQKTADMREELIRSKGGADAGPISQEPDSAPVEPSPAPEEPRAVPKAQDPRLPNFPGLRIERELEGDDQTVAFHARDIENRKPVSVRILAGGLEGIRLQRLEALTTVRHAALFEVLDAGEHDGSTYVVSERPSGQTLAAWMERVGPMPEPAAVALAVQVARGMRQASFHSVHHGDLAPECIRVDASGRVRVDRVGLLVLRPDNYALLPHPEYASPERLRGGPLPDDRSDIYSLGAILHHMLSGLPPFSGDREEITRAQKALPFPDVRTVRPEISDALAEIVLKMGSRDPDQRYVTWDQAQLALERVGGARRRGPSAVQTFRQRMQRWASTNPVAFAAASLAPFVLAALIATLLS